MSLFSVPQLPGVQGVHAHRPPRPQSDIGPQIDVLKLIVKLWLKKIKLKLKVKKPNVFILLNIYILL